MAFRVASRLLARSSSTALGGAIRRTPVHAARVAPALVSSPARSLATSSARAHSSRANWNAWIAGAGLAISLTVGSAYAQESVDYEKVREAIREVLEEEGYDDGSYGPIFVRLAWHASGTFNKADGSGGSDGATMRFYPECKHAANAGLQVARTRLESVKRRFPAISYADLWTLAGAVAIEEMGGPKIEWRSGRSDASSPKACPPDGRLPDAAQGSAHLRDVFYRMGFNDREIVALAGAHVLGRCHANRSGFEGPWTNSPTTFSNDYFVQLSQNKWSIKKWSGPKQYEDPTGTLMMLPADMDLLNDASFRKVVLEYAEDEEAFFRDFASAFARLMELGCNNLQAGFVSKLASFN